MERFRPDNWYELWLRPFLMLDPGSGVYFEFPAPDLRFAVLLVFVCVVLLSKRWAALPEVTRRVLIGLLVTMWCWSYVSGNGRYFLPGLLLVGPLTISLLTAMKVSTVMRWALMGFVLFGQIAVVSVMYVPNPLVNLKWIDKDPVGLPDSPLRNKPAVFTVVGGNSFSALVPHFHPDSRWISLLGHYSVSSDGVQHERLIDALAGRLEKYVVADGARESPEKRAEAAVQLRDWLNIRLAQHGLRLADEPCQFLEREDSSKRAKAGTISLEEAGRWFCRFETAPDASVREKIRTVPQLHRDAFAVIERICPRFFPPRSGQDFRGDGVSFRVYPGADTQLRARDDGSVAYRYQLALNPTLVGRADQVVAGAATINCKKLEGRYQLPWNR
jgi:hypothetical protein